MPLRQFARLSWHRLARVLRRGAASPTFSSPPTAPAFSAFVCNVCGSDNYLPITRITREDGHCRKCQCYGRLRAVVHAWTANRYGPDVVLADLESDRSVRGLGCSDWGYASYLADWFDYTNTFYDHEPRLDLKSPDSVRFPLDSYDFILCSDVLEHVPPPVESAFQGIFSLLRPGGVVVLTVPTTLSPNTCEHFPNLHDWQIVDEGGRRVLINRRADAVVERFTDLCFHGGEGMTLEFRVFSRLGLLRALRGVGFQITAIHDQPVPANGIPLAANNFVVVARKSQAS